MHQSSRLKTAGLPACFGTLGEKRAGNPIQCCAPQRLRGEPHQRFDLGLEDCYRTVDV